MNGRGRPVARIAGVTQTYGRVVALHDVSIEIPAGGMVGFIGPDGVGKSTLLSLIAGSRRMQSGTVLVLGGDMGSAAHRAAVCPRIAYMPQGLGKNLYADLSVRENIEFFGRLFGQSRSERDEKISELLDSTGLAPFSDRPAKKLSGGMRQKLGLCCCLIHDPDLLILDEPTTGVDPLSRRQFWELIDRMRSRSQGMSVVVATAYMEEAERFDWLAAMTAGKVLATGPPSEVKAKAGAATLEEAFIALLPDEERRDHKKLQIPPRRAADGEPIIVARDLTCRFGDFTAVDRVSFTIERGEIFGFLGSNGSGKTTTMKMLTGLLTPSAGEALLFGKPLEAGDMSSRYRVGYMSQSFSLYTELTVLQNLELHAHLFNLPADKAKARIAELVAWFGLADYLDQRTSDLPLGIRQRLSLAVAIVHEPEILILDEPTSGVDPLARDRFWEALIDLSRKQGVTIFVSTHFMNEAERCDRISLMDSGRVLATGTPAQLVASRGVATLEDAFISYLEEADGNGRFRDQGSHAGKPKNPSGAAADTGTFMVQPAAHAGLYDPRDPRVAARPDPARLQPVRHDALDAGVWLWRLDRCQQPLLRRARPRSESRKPRLSRGAQRFELFHREAAARRLRRARKSAQKREHQGRYRNPARLWPRHQARTSCLGRRLGRWRDAVQSRDHPRLPAGDARALSDGSGGENHRIPQRLSPPISNSGSNTTRTSTASTRWFRRTCPCSWRYFRPS